MTHLPERRTPGVGDRPPPTALWTDGAFRLRVVDAPGGPPRDLAIARPFAVVGRLPGADVQVDDRAVSGRHLYLHLDARGLFAVDLATRTGTRFDGRERPSGWLRPGQVLEVAGRRIELLECRLRADADADADARPPADLLADAGAEPLARVTLYPAGGAGSPRTLGSELVFLGRGACCGVRVEAATASRTHCVLVRGREAAYVVDLIGRGASLNDRPIPGAVRLEDGDALTIGSARFEVRVRPPGAPGDALAVRTAPRVEVLPAGGPPGTGTGTGPGALPAEAQGALLAWMMNQLHVQQGEAMRRQSEFQDAMTGLVRQMQSDQAALLSRHLEHSEAIQRELISLREELDRRLKAPAAPPAELPRPRARPLDIDPAPRPSADAPEASTSWLIGRINQLEEESRSSWKDFLGRLAGPGPRRAT